MTDWSSLPPHIDPERSDEKFWEKHKKQIDTRRNKTIEELSQELDIQNMLTQGKQRVDTRIQDPITQQKDKAWKQKYDFYILDNINDIRSKKQNNKKDDHIDIIWADDLQSVARYEYDDLQEKYIIKINYKVLKIYQQKTDWLKHTLIPSIIHEYTHHQHSLALLEDTSSVQLKKTKNKKNSASLLSFSLTVLIWTAEWL